jgi:NADPH:quinone reductase-like Zn-dependent oxidoreductase
MRAWQYKGVKGGLENNLKLNADVPMPVAKDPKKEHLIQVLAVCLNPVDYKIAELLPSFIIPKPATPGIDLVGKIETPAQGSNLEKGDLVFGVSSFSPASAGALADYAVSPVDCIVKVPSGVKPVDAATIGVAGLSAYQTIVPHVKEGDKIFINGGSGGVGVFSIQIAKIAGCHVTTSCSTPNVELCKSLGADEVIDYKKGNVLEELTKRGGFNHVVDNVGNDPQLFWQAHKYSEKEAKFVGIAGEPSLRHLAFSSSAKFWPGFLGGGKRKFLNFLAEPKPDELEQMATWMAEGKLKAVIDSTFPFDQAPDAFRKLKTGRAKGKIAVTVTSSDL